jgi:AraC-like DNA-binding protein
MTRLGPRELPHLYFQFSLAGFGHFEQYGRPARRIEPGTAFFAIVPSRHRYYLPPDSPGWTFGWIGIYHPYVLSRISQQVTVTGPVIRTPPSCALIARAMRLVRGAYEKDFRDRLQVEEALFGFALAFERMVQQAKNAEASSLLDDVRRRVSTQPAEPISVEQLAHEHDRTRSAFGHFFKARTGKSPARFAMEVRIDEAAHLLAATELPLRAIAERCGFANPNHFGKAFRRFRNQTPGAFRRLVRRASTAP